tara:strand:+ start:578 stop:778 length:201 start_codon:yes stop_codon:yes gene_type:complete
MESLTIKKQDFADLMNAIEDIQLKMESIELMQDKEFMDSLKKSDEEVKNRDFADWNELQNIANKAI